MRVLARKEAFCRRVLHLRNRREKKMDVLLLSRVQSAARDPRGGTLHCLQPQQVCNAVWERLVPFRNRLLDVIDAQFHAVCSKRRFPAHDFISGFFRRRTAEQRCPAVVRHVICYLGWSMVTVTSVMEIFVVSSMVASASRTNTETGSL
ncbi:hypothetical protein SDC9_140472 [bioreactor metagenome]|uniref:Uncharacterized protein n=1 Tax=bioreactor metagenome TaxID=1076179 RepID=A0A645DVL4_9ZZZZ